MNSVDLAKKICVYAHKGQYDKAGIPYFEHPFVVASYMDTEEEKIVAYLHDVLEDTTISVDELSKCDFSNNVIESLKVITRNPDDDYQSYIKKISKNKIARKVKMADLIHNSDLSRIEHPSKKDIARCEKYRKAMIYLATH